nr:hypothetical protein CFP56_16574 [Quercus suber]
MSRTAVRRRPFSWITPAERMSSTIKLLPSSQEPSILFPSPCSYDSAINGRVSCLARVRVDARAVAARLQGMALPPLHMSPSVSGVRSHMSFASLVGRTGGRCAVSWPGYCTLSRSRPLGQPMMLGLSPAAASLS